MKVVGSLLDRFKNLEAPERFVRSATIEAIVDIVGVTLGKSSIKINNRGVIYITGPSSVKAAIFENKDNIISRINNLLKKTQIKDIK